MARPARINISEGAMRLLTQSGYTFADIATLHRISPASVTRVAKRYGIAAPVHQAATQRQVTVRDALDDWGGEIPTTELSRRLDIPATTARRHRQSIERAEARHAVRTASAYAMPDFARNITRMLQ